ncbi:hypothetical protein [Streptomyces sp. NPDC055013]
MIQILPIKEPDPHPNALPTVSAAPTVARCLPSSADVRLRAALRSAPFAPSTPASRSPCVRGSSRPVWTAPPPAGSPGAFSRDVDADGTRETRVKLKGHLGRSRRVAGVPLAQAANWLGEHVYEAF